MIIGELPSMDYGRFLTIGGDIMHSPLFYLIVSSIALDFVTGMGKAFITGQYSSKIGLEGIVKHTMILLLIIFIKFFGRVFDISIIAQGITVLFSFNYGASIIENLEASGIEFPQAVKDRFYQMKDKANEDFKIEDIDKVVITKKGSKKGVDR